VADSKDPAVKTMQVAGANRAINPAPGVTQRPDQLADRNDSMLPLRQISQRLRFSRKVSLPFAPHTGGKDRRTPISPPYPAAVRPATTLYARKKAADPEAGGSVKRWRLS
jgi:hypothetical protein